MVHSLDSNATGFLRKEPTRSFKVEKSSMIVQAAFPRHHSWAAQLSFSEEGLLWSTWKATQGRVLPRENPKKELNTTNVASSFTTAACCVSPREIKTDFCPKSKRFRGQDAGD